MIDETVNEPGQEPERVGFCQDCGRPLTRETVRPVGSGVFCEPCLEARLGTAAPPYGVPVPPPVAGAPYNEPFPPMGGHNPSPTLAALLGFIPGVGAMYNGQFAKGIAHIVIYAILQSLANANAFFGIFVAGWIIYQAFDAFHTAKARREGMPLPDPFGLNNIGHQVAAHFRANTQGVPPPPSANYPGYAPPVVPPAPVGTVVEPPAQAWGGVPSTPSASPYTQAAPVWDSPAWTPPPTGTVPAAYAVPPVNPSRFPGAAVWLIGFGLIFLVLNIVPEWRFSVGKIFPFLLMALGVGLFIRRMTFTGGVAPGASEGEAYAARAVGSLRWPVILFTVGVLWALREFDVVPFHTWPVLIIVIGVMLLLERSVGNRIVPIAPAGVSPDASATNSDGKVI